MKETNSYKQLRENLMSLNLNQMAIHLDEVIDFGIQSGASLTEVLVKLTNHQIEVQEKQKTHLATSIGVTAALARHNTYFTKCHDLIQKLRTAKQENRLESKLKHFSRYRLLIIDEIGYLPIDAEDAKIFFQLIDQWYEKKARS